MTRELNLYMLHLLDNIVEARNGGDMNEKDHYLEKSREAIIILMNNITELDKIFDLINWRELK